MRTFDSAADLNAYLRKEAERLQMEAILGRRSSRHDAGDAFAYAAAAAGTNRRNTNAPPKPSAPSKFDGPDVIDLVLGADGVWMVPAVLEPRVRAL